MCATAARRTIHQTGLPMNRSTMLNAADAGAIPTWTLP
jgi:hypothetical protein